MAGQFAQFERRRAGHVGIDKERQIADRKVGDMFDLQLHVLLAVDIDKLQPGDTFNQQWTERIIAAPGIAVAE